eukprot:Blabericola_migrator_1__12872@NODE_83_length_14926_cov_238_210041_g74_i0_p11_GENE_NODE_83_length_14926_cov_238_210041_g74_i0NODE_83_length_14926_cov_238_210041_g74_i0_p11_ORF_typecomplete_len121_score28_03SecE/PF00584_20/7_5e09BPL_N/PF09825_9/0_1CBP_BcsG/PF11658_8/0_16CEND1/PF15677_5/2_1_NODE_83_length_14926_cov_238_210041_g74_i053175679
MKSKAEKAKEAQFNASIEELNKYNQQVREEAAKDGNVIADHDLVKGAVKEYESLKTRVMSYYNEGESFIKKCRKPNKKEMKILLIYHGAAFAVLAILGVVVKILFGVLSSILMLPKPGSF